MFGSLHLGEVHWRVRKHASPGDWRRKTLRIPDNVSFIFHLADPGRPSKVVECTATMIAIKDTTTIMYALMGMDFRKFVMARCQRFSGARACNHSLFKLK